ncbi:MAG TPA: flavodoxin domain-containing protein, partial [Rhodanobacteraceae bacterium]|nr:flavodoxin domain-containing protein [Rhodanobacteraceae bacterium]
MSAVPAEILPTPLSADKVASLTRFADGLGPHELYWVAAWASRRATGLPVVLTPVPAPAPVGKRLTVLYGSQTGNAKRCAERIAAQAEAAQLPVRVVRADAYPTRDLARETHLLLVISTQGEGEPPDDARGLFDFIAGKRAPKLAGLAFAVLGLGDSSYPEFCTIGQRLDARLEELGASRFAPF